jgi:hypothetical protein
MSLSNLISRFFKSFFVAVPSHQSVRMPVFERDFRRAIGARPDTEHVVAEEDVLVVQMPISGVVERHGALFRADEGAIGRDPVAGDRVAEVTPERCHLGDQRRLGTGETCGPQHELVFA